MNVVFFIGNGFDINLGMKTRYCDFYDHYKKVISESKLVNRLKHEISEGVVNWSDLELAFGKYTSNLKNLEEFEEVYYDIAENLADYLIEEESNTSLKNIKKDVFLKDLCFPENYLLDEDIQELRTYRSNWSNSSWGLNIITLNYTLSIEKILTGYVKESQLGVHEYGNSITLKNIYHIHGYTDKRFILGVNDISQIKNKDFYDNEDILETLIKTRCNKIQRHNIDKACERIIEKANLICIFGSSIGDTDIHWWQSMGEQLRRDCKIIIFSKGEDIKERFAQRAVRKRREIINLFLNKTSLSEEEKEKFKGNIYVGINTKIFDIL